MKEIRVRYAPSPTGLLHIGNARSALFNYVFAKHFGGKFIIRIEDTDVLRNVEGGEESQLKYLSWLGLSWDESPDKGGIFGPYRQLERLELYQKYANELLEKNFAYKEYSADGKKFAIRFKVPEDKTYEFSDLVRGNLKFESKEIEDWIIMKDNGIPTYNFAVVIDDHLMQISHVLRGEEHITNTPKQIMVYQAFNWEIPLFAHMTIIVNEEKKKLSKRDKNVVQFISEYEELGFLPEAMFNFISLLGFSSATNEEIMSKEEIIKNFDPKRLSKSPAMFDKNKLAYINSRYIKMLEKDKLVQLVKKYFIKAQIEIISDDWLEKFVELFKDRMVYLSEITKFYQEFFHSEFELDDEKIKFLNETNSLNLLNAFLEDIKSLDDFSSENIEKTIKEVSLKTKIKGKNLFIPLRIATTSNFHGPSLPITISLLKKDVIIKRIEKTIKILGG